jgi:DNA-binding transcriptional regulator YhcF (GntR family)
LKAQSTTSLTLKLRRGSGVSLVLQIADGIREAQHRGKLKRGEELPSTRELARQLGVSRNTVVQAYEELVSAGVIEARAGSKTVVAGGSRRPAPRNWRVLLQGSGYPGRAAVCSDPDGTMVVVFAPAIRKGI